MRDLVGRAVLLAGAALAPFCAPAVAQNPAAPAPNAATPPEQTSPLPGSTNFNNTAATAISPAAAQPPEPGPGAVTPGPAAADAGIPPPPAPVASGTPGGEEGQIVVTGSRLARTTFETPTPVTALGEKQLQAKAASTAFELLRDVPQLRPNRNNGSATDVGGSYFNMRSLGQTRTLLLLNGQRVLNSSPTGGFDLNILPAPLINRLEIVTGGASSVYGSDAVTGVVNVFLDGQLKGGRFDAQYDVSTYGDAKNYSVSGAYGTGFADDRGHVVVAASYYDRPEILYQNARPWGDKSYVLLTNPAYTATNGQYRQFILPNTTLSQMTLGGVITTNNPLLKNITFEQNGAQGRLIQGTNIGTVYMTGGTGLLTPPQYGVLISSSERKNGYGRLSFDLTDSLQIWADVLAAQSRQRQTNVPNYNNADITVNIANPFIPANIRAIMVAQGLQNITVGRLNTELGVNDNTTTNTYLRTSGGLKGDLFKGWTWDAGAIYTRSVYNNTSLNNRNNANWTAALDVVTGPNGQPVCRSTLTNPTNGCVPANIFGINAVSPQTVAYATGTSFIKAFSHSIDAMLNAKGNLFSTWAGPISAATGFEYRRDDVNLTSDPISAIGGWRQASSAPYTGKLRVAEVYGEVGVPLAKDLRFARNLELDLAGRYVNYSTSGGTWVWKVGANWSVDNQIRFRASYSRDFRAPTINELFAAATVRQGTNVVNRNTNIVDVVRTRSGGNANLQPEVAHTFTGGVVLRPDFIPDLQFSVDAFNIKLDGAITALGAQEVVDRCFAGDNTFCSVIVRNGNVITEVGVPNFNATVLKTRGLDFELSYRHAVGPGVATLSSVASYTDRLITIVNGLPVNTAGQLTGTYATPKWRGATTVTYQVGGLLVRSLINLIGSGRYDNTYGPLDLLNDHFGKVIYVDFSAEYTFKNNIQFYAKIENAFNRAPPLIADNAIIRAGAAGASNFYDYIGRNFGVGVRYRF